MRLLYIEWTTTSICNYTYKANIYVELHIQTFLEKYIILHSITFDQILFQFAIVRCFKSNIVFLI